LTSAQLLGAEIPRQAANAVMMCIESQMDFVAWQEILRWFLASELFRDWRASPGQGDYGACRSHTL